MANKLNGTTLYRVAMFFIILSVTPFSKLLPRIEGFVPLWEQMADLVLVQKENQKKFDELISRAETLERKINAVETRVQQVELKFTGFEIDFKRYRTLREDKNSEFRLDDQ